MPIVTNKLDQGTFDAIRQGKRKKGRYYDGDNLLIQVARSGSASWVFRYRRNGERKSMGLGSCSRLGLAAARAKARALRFALTEQRDPLAEKKSKVQPLPFDAVLDQCLAEAQEPREDWLSMLTRHAAPILKVPVDEIGAEHIKELLEPIWLTKSVTADKVRRRVGVVWDFARAKRMCSGDNPTRYKECLKPLGLPPLSLRGRPTKRRKAMKWRDAPAFLACLAEREELEALALEFMILTNVRTGSIVGAPAKGKRAGTPALRWSDLDRTKEHVWSVPKLKMDRAVREEGERFRIPLSERALAVLEKVKVLGLPGERVFCFGKNAMRDLLKKEMGIAADPHGFRTSFRTWAAEQTKFPRHVIETCMAHKLKVEGGEVEASYLDTSFLEERRKLMDAWEAFLSGGKGNVVPLVQPPEPEAESAAVTGVMGQRHA